MKMILKGSKIPLVLLVIVSVSVFGAVGAQGAKYEEKADEKIEIRAETRIVIEGKGGDITVIGEENRVEVLVETIKTVRAENEDEAKRLAGMMEIEVTRAGDELKISTKYPKRGDVKKSILNYLLQRYPRLSMDIRIAVPRELEIEIKTASGDVSVSEVLGFVEITAASGDVEVVDVGSSVDVNISSGNIYVEGIGGKARLNSSSGDISGGDIKGDVFAKTSSGDVELYRIGRDIEVKSASGDVTVDGMGSVFYEGISGSAKFLGVRGGVRAASASGDLSFRLTPNVNVDYTVTASSGDILMYFIEPMTGGFVLRAGTTSGDITANLPIKISKVGRNRISGIVRDGKSKIILETASGDISIMEPEE